MNARIDHVRQVMQSAETIKVPEDLQPDQGNGGGDQDEAAATPPEGHAAELPLNDVGNGQRFIIYEGEDTLQVPRVGWFCWDGRAWAKDDDNIVVRRRAQTISDRILGEVAFLTLPDWSKEAMEQLNANIALKKKLMEDEGADPEALIHLEEKIRQGHESKVYFSKLKKDHRTFAKSTGNTSKIDAMLREAGVHLSRVLDDLDADPLTINCENGTIRFTRDASGVSMAFADHQRSDLLSKMLPVNYAPRATAPGFDAFLQRVMPDPVMRAFIQRSLGLSLTGLTIQHLWFFYGQGANGKSVLIDLIARILGNYAATAKIESLTGQSKRSGQEATPDLVPLMGARFVRASEPEEGERLKEGVIKELTGGEPILVRALHSDFVEVKPKFKLFISGNHRPEIRGTDDGIWRRMLLVPFDVQIPEAERDVNLGKRLFEEERAGILNWMLDGLRDYLENGLAIPDQVRAATAEYREDSDPVGSFLTNSCIVDASPETFTATRDLVDAFQWWQAANGDTPWQNRTIALRLKDKAGRWSDANGKSFTAGKRSIKGYFGIKLTDEFLRMKADSPDPKNVRPTEPQNTYTPSLKDF